MSIEKEQEMDKESERTGIGGNNPPENQRIEQIMNPEEIEKAYAGTVADLSGRADAILDTYARIPKEIGDDETHEKVVAVVARIRTVNADRDKQRKEAKDPYLKGGKAIDDVFKLTDEKGKRIRSKEMENAITDLSKRLSVYDTKKYQQQKAKEEAEAKTLAEQAAKDGIEMSGDAPDTKMTSVQSEHGGTGVRSIKKVWKVTDEAKIPRGLFTLDHSKVDKMIADGAESIPGIEITEEVVTSVRR